MRDVKFYLDQIEASIERREMIDLFNELQRDFEARDIIDGCLDLAEQRKSHRVLSFAQVANQVWLEQQIDVSLKSARRIVDAQWSHVSSDAIGRLQKFGRADDIGFLQDAAVKSAYHWLERDDENQQFFRKCVSAIAEIGSRDNRTNKHLNSLHELAEVDSKTASYWAKKQLNALLGSRSKFADADLDEQPEPDLEWPGNRNFDVLLHPIFAEHDAQTIVVYQAYSDEIGKVAAAQNTLDVPGFSKSRMTWIKPSFLWMMYRSGWGTKDPRQSTILRLRLRRPEFSYLVANATLSHSDRDDPDAWEKRKTDCPNRIQWDPDRDGAGKPLERRAIQLGIAPAFVDFFLNRAIVGIEDITEQVQMGRTSTSRNQLLPTEPVFWKHPKSSHA